MDEDAKMRLAELVVAGRVRRGFRTTKAFAAHTGLTTRTLSDVENGRRTNFDASTIAIIEAGLGWAPGSIRAVLAGGNPTLVEGDVPQPEDELVGSGVHPSDFSLEEWTKLWLAAQEAARDNPDA